MTCDCVHLLGAPRGLTMFASTPPCHLRPGTKSTAAFDKDDAVPCTAPDTVSGVKAVPEVAPLAEAPGDQALGAATSARLALSTDLLFSSFNVFPLETIARIITLSVRTPHRKAVVLQACQPCLKCSNSTAKRVHTFCRARVVTGYRL